MKNSVTKLMVAIFFSTLIGCQGQGLRKSEAGALTGGALGAGLGAIIGHKTGSAGAGVAIGSAFGALSGALIGNEMDNQDEALNEQDRRLEDQDHALAENRRLIDELRSQGVEAHVTSRGVVASLPDVLFDFNRAELRDDAHGAIRAIRDAARRASGRRLAVEGHTDSVGTVEYNKALSVRRARSVASALVDQGVSRGRISVYGFGESHPIASNSTERGRQENRRVEVIIENR